MEFWNSFNVYNDNNNLLIKEIKSVGGNIGGILRVLGEWVQSEKVFKNSQVFSLDPQEYMIC